MGRSYAFGLAIGSLWLLVAATGFSALIVALMQAPAEAFELAALAGVGAAFVTAGIAAVRAAQKLPKPAESMPSGAAVRRRFIVVFAIELVLLAVVNSVCIATRNFEYIVPLDLIIVGAHVLPLAGLFGVPRYYVLGIGFCAIAIATMVFVAPSAHTGAASSWIVFPTFGCAALAVVVGLMGLRESWQLARPKV
jgi:hypothetical protein